MADVAAAAGVSHQTVSRVLNGSELVREDTRARVLEAISRLGYRRNAAARLLATNRSGRIGMVAAHLAYYGPSRIAVAVQEAGFEAGYEVALVSLTEFSSERLTHAVERLLDQAVEAVVVAVAHEASLDLVRSLDLDVPVVMCQGVSRDQVMAAGIDQVAVGRLATDHLLDLGHRHVAHVTGPLDWVEAVQRREGWRAAHADRGLLPGPELPGDWEPASGHEAGRRIAADPSVTAVFCANDTMALGVLQALHRAGRRVPEDISVVGVDDVPEAAYYWPSLTTVAQDLAGLGRTAVGLAVEAIAAAEPRAVDLARPELLVRATTARPAVVPAS